ncbi:MAG: UDP-N-acetylmuramate dehydrogenase [Chryseobacterium sp.]|nr:MAG: UDP-N-acetylmuramate dehydrogenase [Chryseobacterium sp.]
MDIRRQVSLKKYNTFGVDVGAAYFAEVASTDELQKALQFAERNGLRLLVLGAGSNVLFTRDFDGLVIRLNLKGIETSFADDAVLVTAAAGENWHSFVQDCIDQDYGGLENLSLIPGHVGTAPIQNIGAYGVEIKDVFETCQVFDTETRGIRDFKKDECEFGYRDSVFKRNKGRYIILQVTFRLTVKDHKISSHYGAIEAELQKRNITAPTLRDIADVVIAIRQSKLPDPAVTGNAGSFFKNPVIPMEAFERLKHRHPEIPGYSDGTQVKVPAGWLIEQCGWRGKTIDNVGSHALQSLVLINATGKAAGQEIYDFSQLIIDSVQQEFGIGLEREVNVI